MDSVKQNLEDQGLFVQKKDKSIFIRGTQFDVKGKITTMTSELVKRTEDLNKNIITSVAATQQIKT